MDGILNMVDMTFQNIRVLWLEDKQCILFNSSLKRTSRVCPTIIGLVVEKVIEGKELKTAIREEKATQEERREIERLIAQIGGGQPPAIPLGKTEHRFYRTLTLAPSSNCNLRCIYCSGDAGERINHVMDWEMAKAAIEYFFDHCYKVGPYTLQFHGAGEPMTAPEIIRKSVEYATACAAKRNQSLLTRISTNGVMSEEQAIWLSENMNHISLSLDGEPYFQNEQRPLKNGNNSYDTVIRSLSIFKKKGVLKRINIVVTNEGIDSLASNLEHIHELCGDVDVRILPMESCGRSKKINLTPVDRTYFQKRLDEIMDIAENMGIHILTAIEQMNYCTAYYCQACGHAMCVTPSGEVSTCVEAMASEEKGIDELFIGQYKRELKKFEINWDKVARLRERTYDNLESCKKCSFLTNCAGSCLIRAARKHGTVFAVDETACDMVKTVLTNQLKIIASNRDYDELTFKEMQDLSLQIHKKFEKMEARPWGIEAAVLELSKQMGDLSKLILGQEHYYLSSREHDPTYAPSKDRIGNELADMLHWLIWIADYYEISIPQMHIKARQDEWGYINENQKNQDA